MKSKFRSALALVLSLATVMCYSAPVGFAADTDTGQDTPPSAEESVYLLTDYQQGGDDSGTVIKEFYVTADRNSVVGGTGTEIKLEAKIDADNYSGDVTWESSDSSVATITGTGTTVTATMGRVTQETDVTITATLADGSTASTVIEVKPVLVTSVKISGQNAEKYLVKNDRTRGSEQLTVNVEPKNAVDRTVIWTSSDESVLTVDNNGKVTATGQGTATVRAMNEASGVYDEVTYAVYSETPIESRNIKKAQQGFLGGFSADRRTSSEINSWVTNQYQDNCDQNFRLPADETPVKADSIVQKSFMNPNIYYINTVRIGSFIPGKQADWDTMKDAPKATYFRTHKLGNYYVIQYRTDNNPDSTTGWKYLKSDEYICAAYNIIRNEITDDDSLYKGTKITIGDWPFEGNQTSKKIIEIKLIDAEQNKVVYNSGPMYYSEGNPTEYFGRIIFNCDTSRYEIDHVTVSNYNNKDSKTIKLGDSIKDRAKYTDEGISVYFKSGRADHYTVTGYVTSKEFDVTYDPDNGEYPQTEKVKAVTDGKITELTVSDQIPTKDDHIFTGWLYGGKTYHEGDKLEMPPEDVTFTASWIPKSKVITYKSSDTGMGTVTRSYERLKDGQEAVGSTAVPNQGYTFLGWYDGDKKVSDDATFKPTEVGSYTAKFGYQQLAIKSNDGTWTYDGYEHSAPGANITYGGKTINATEIGSSTLEGTLNPGQTALVLSNFATITDPGQKDNTYDWKVVRKGKDGTLTNLTNKFKDNTSTEYGTLTVNPIVTFDANGGSNVDPQTVKYKETADESKAATSREGYTFTGWYSDKDLKNKYDFKTPVTENITLYAGWTQNEYTVSFEPNGGSKVDPQTVKYKETADESKAATSREGYTFTGWYSDKELKDKYDFKTPVTENITLYAGWTKNSTPNPPTPITQKYTLTYVTNGGNEIAPEKYNEGVTVKLTKEPTRRGFSFTGWYSDPELNNAVTSVKMDKDKKVYAGWKSSVPEILDSNNHEAYVAGYEDGSVKPMNNITREETAAIIFRLLDGKVRNDNLVDTNGFDDVLSTRWSNVEISTLESMQIIRGRSAGEFDPSAPITRAEFASMFARMSTVTASDLNIKPDKFSDIDGHWAAADINKAVALGWISGYPDGTFHPDAYITRAEAMTLINSVLQRAPASADELLTGVTWTDNTDPSAWYYISVQEATNSHEYDRSELVAPDEKWTKIKPTPDWDALRHKVRDNETENGAQTDQAAENNGTAGN
ncbi:MAG: InlB B-repeat-containing protein [Anaerovoracaceae bacterium]|nr:InlB B-repeat-containing protein [Anaerovoracaceae bacterium]